MLVYGANLFESLFFILLLSGQLLVTMSVSIGRGRASMLRRSVSAEPERDRPGGLTVSSSSVTESPDSTSPSATPVKNIKLKKLTFQKPRLPKLRLSSHQISPDDNNNSNSPNSGMLGY